MTRSDKIFQVWSLIATVLQLDYNLVTFLIMAMATLIDILKPVRTGESTLPLHLVKEARICSDDRKMACQTATETKGSSTSATNQAY